MNRFCVIANAEKDKNYELAEYIRSYLITKGKKCILVRDRFVDMHIGKYVGFDEIPEDTECIIILGGDGTMIQAAKDLQNRKIPLLGVNLGTLGFLTEIEKQDLEASLDELFLERYKIQRRIMLRGKTTAGAAAFDNGTALNDFVISKDGQCRLIELAVYVGDEFIDTYVADGLILSTPTGSTGYNLSAGGPVIAPEVHAIIITPICPHSLNKRSLVVSAEDRVTVKIGKIKENSDDEAVVLIDGNEDRKLRTGDMLEVTCSGGEAQIIKLEGFSFFKRMRQKLNRDISDTL